MNSYRVEVRWNSAALRFEALGFSDLLMDIGVETSLRRELEIEQKLADANPSPCEPEAMLEQEGREYTSEELEGLADAWLLAQDGQQRVPRSKAWHLAEYLRMKDQCCAIAEHLCNAQSLYLRTRDPEQLVNQTYIGVAESFPWSEATTRRVIQRMYIQIDGSVIDARTLMNARANPGVIFLVAKVLRANPREGAPAQKRRLAQAGISMSERNVGKMLKTVRQSMQPTRQCSDFFGQ